MTHRTWWAEERASEGEQDRTSFRKQTYLMQVILDQLLSQVSPVRRTTTRGTSS